MSGPSVLANKSPLKLRSASLGMTDVGRSFSPPAIPTFMQNFFLGALSAGTIKTVMAPIERVKLLLQTQDANPELLQKTVQRYTGIGNCFLRVYREQGFGAFWRGNSANVIRYVPQQACNFAFKDLIKTILQSQVVARGSTRDLSSHRHGGHSSQLRSALAVNVTSAALGAAMSTTCCYPLNVARLRLATDIRTGTKTFSGITDCLWTIGQAQGIRGIYHGLLSSLINTMLYRGAQMGFFDTLGHFNPYMHDEAKRLHSLAFSVVIAQVAGFFAVVVSYAPETVTRRMQMESEKPVGQRLYRGSLHCVSHVMRREGLRGLYQGFWADVVRSTGAAVVLVAYDQSKKFLEVKQRSSS